MGTAVGVKIVLVVLLGAAAQTVDANYRRVCYYGSWAIYRHGHGHFQPEYIDPHLCTHIIYSFVGVKEDGTIKLFDSWNDIGDSWHKGQIQRVHALKKSNPNLKLMIACGGWNFGSATFSHIAHDGHKRQVFADSAANFVKKYGYDGFDFDWEYPGSRGGSPSDKQAFSEMIKVFRRRFDRDRLLLSAATSASPKQIDHSYDVHVLSQYLDFINVMAYDLHGSWDHITGHNSPLNYGHYLARTNGPKDLYDVAIVKFYLSRGANPQKINLGVPFYARTFTLQNPHNHGFGAPIRGPGHGGTFYNEPGSLAYNEICFEQTQNKWQNFFDNEQGVPYSVKGDQWIGYDDKRSLRLKINLIKQRGLGGVMLWSIETDDFAGICRQGKYPLLNLLRSELH